MWNFEEKVVLVTGSGSGIGRDVAIAFAKAGATVVGTDINVETGVETEKLVQAEGGNGLFLHADIANTQKVEELISLIVQTYGRLDIAFNNAGVEGQHKRLADGNEEDFDLIMGVNVKGVWGCMKYELRQMLKQGSGSIINTSSVAGLTGSHSMSIYAASKHAVIGLTRSAAVEYGDRGIRVNCVNPYIINTPMANRGLEQAPEPFINAMKHATPAKRFGEADEVTTAVLWLASDQASFINGICLPVDGGFTAQ